MPASPFVAHVCGTARNNLWSNHRLLRACEALTPAEFAAPRTGFFPSLRATLNHILWVDLYYVDVLAGADALRRYAEAAPDFVDAASLRVAQQASDRRLLAVCEGLDDAGLVRLVETPRPNRKPPPIRVEALLAHLFQHQIHHRGQAHAMLSSTAVKPPQLDEFFFPGELDLRRDELRTLGLPEV